MRWNVRVFSALVVALAAFGVSRASAQALVPRQANPAPAPAPAEGQGQRPAAAVDPQKLPQLLDRWEQNSANLKSLDVNIKRTDKSPAWLEDEVYEGRAILKTPNRAWLNFEKVIVGPGNKPTLVPHERIICTGSEVWQYRCDSKQIFIYPLEKDMQQRALEEGPLPFLFNFKAAEAQKRYHMKLIAEEPNFYIIQIIPRLEIDKESFSEARVKLDRKTYLLPSRIFLISTEGKSTKDFELSGHAPNKDVQDANFQGQVIKDWKVVRNPSVDRAAPAAASAPAAPRVAQPKPAAAAPAPQPAMRPRILGGRRN